MSTLKKGIHDRLNRVSHWDVNVTNLERSRAWYEATTTLRVFARTYASQDFPSLRLRQSSFKGLMMRDSTLPPGAPMIHLVEWTAPQPVGKPNLSHAHVGWFRIVPTVESIEATRQAVLAQGSEPFTSTTDSAIRLSPTLPDLHYQVFTVHDPDGVAVEFSDKRTQAGLVPTAPYTVAHNTANFEKNLDFYLNVLGLDFHTSVQTQSSIPNVYSPGGGSTGFSGAFFTVRGNQGYVFDWLQWNESPEHPKPYEEANHVGIVRCSIEVDDVDASYTILKHLSRSQRPFFSVAEPEVWDFGPEFGVRKVVNFQDPEGVGFQLVEQPRFPVVLHPWGHGAEQKQDPALENA
ncbi:hypothetical protein FB567DRAFT_602978 [Paraphoma chrysanthemicola]|uniref:VOC domain-containing protein n=1 Tax=Paraphoma chrysanthemicola TaxID=798071 RepID=A0A8K0VXB0_9PLEO|nr:hypothetical protein FB567DRAFT_602978 [Paraphoma chrysanthemicola]